MALMQFLQLFFVFIPYVMSDIEMKFTKYPQSVTAPVGDKVTFECAVSVPGDRIAWRWRTVDQTEDKWTAVAGTGDRDKMSSRLVVEVKDDSATAFYQCVVWYGGVSLASVPARLSIARLNLSKDYPEKRVIIAPLYNPVILHCRQPSSEPPAVLSWWKQDSRGNKKHFDTPYGVLVIVNATEADSGIYGCTATNELSSQVVDLPEKTFLKVQHEGHGPSRFLESEEYVGKVDKEGVLTMPVKLGDTLRLWCGAVGNPRPTFVWKRQGKGENGHLDVTGLMYTIPSFTRENEDVYSCTTHDGVTRSWKAIALEPPHLLRYAMSVKATEGGSAKIECGPLFGNPKPKVHWFLNSELLTNDDTVVSTDSDIYFSKVQKRHAGIVQCFACNELGCVYDAAMLTVVPVQISDQEYSAEAGKTLHFPSQPSKRHFRKNSRKHNKAVMVPPSRPNVTRMSDESVMVSWTNSNHGLPIQFFKVQYKEATNSSVNSQWHTANYDIPPHIHSYEIDGLIPDRYYKFRIAAVYSNQDNNQGRSSARFYLQRGGFRSPRAPVLTRATALSTQTIQLNWTWSSGGGVQAEGFYVYYRAVSSAGEYEKVTAPGGSAARSILLMYLAADTAYELKVQAYTEQAPSEFSSILVAKTHRLTNVTTTEAPLEDAKNSGRAPGALVTAGGALGVAALLVILVVTLLLCRRAKRPTSDKEKGSVPESGPNSYIPGKVPITITANPMHESGEGGVEMSFLHNNNCGNTGNNDDTLPHSRKNGPTRQYV